MTEPTFGSNNACCGDATNSTWPSHQVAAAAAAAAHCWLLLVAHCPLSIANCELHVAHKPFACCPLAVAPGNTSQQSASRMANKTHVDAYTSYMYICQARFICCEPTPEDAANILAADRIFPGFLFRCIFMPKRDGRNVAVSLSSLFFATPNAPLATCHRLQLKPPLSTCHRLQLKPL
jgi:hypothetical protein